MNTGYKVTIYVESGAIGHAFLKLEAPGQPPITVGYYPVVHSPTAPGMIKNDATSGEDRQFHPGDPIKTFDIDASQYAAMVKQVDWVSNHPGEYGVLGNQCTGFVVDTLKVGGISNAVNYADFTIIHPTDLKKYLGDLPADQIKLVGSAVDASQLATDVSGIYQGIAGNDARISQYIQSHPGSSPLVSGDPFTGLAWPGDGSGNIQTSLDSATQAAQTTLAQTPIIQPPNFDTPARDSSSYITNNGAGSHSATISAGGTLSDLWVLQKNSPTGFANAQDFYAAVLASNPNITNVNQIQAGQSIYLPEKIADGSVTYNYAGGASINSNATTGEYNMVVPNADGGQTVYSRTVDLDAGYTVHQVSTDKAGNTTFDFNGHQASLSADILPFAEQWHTGTESGTASFNADGSLVKETVTDTDNNGQLQSKAITDGTTGITTTTDYTTPADPNIQTITTYDAAGNLTGTSTISAALDTSGALIPNSYDIVNKDGTGTITATAERTVNPIDGTHTDLTIGAATPSDPNGTLNFTATDASGNTTPLLSKDAQANLANNAQSFNDAYALIKAIQNNQPLPVVTNGLSLYNDIYHNAPPELLGASGALGALSSLYSLNQALEQGNISGAALSGANAFTQGVNSYVSIAYGDSINAAADGLGGLVGASTAVSEVVPYLNIAYDLTQGNVAGAVGDGVGIYASAMMYAEIGAAAGPVGAVIGLVVGLVLSDLFGDSPPPPWGSASAAWDPASGTIRIHAVGDSGGDTAARNALTNLEGSLSNLAQQYNGQTQPDFQIGIIPQRLGGLSYSNQSFRVSTIDPATGTSLNPNLSFSASTGQALNASVTDPAYFQSLGQYYINNALARQAIAPQWEVQTAQQQAANGVSNASLSEVERAADLGHLATVQPAGATTESWNPIGIDLGGGLATSSLAGSSVQFNVDGTANLDARISGTSSAQYLKQTAWLNKQDGFLVLDKNVNGGIDNAEELFSNSQVNAQSRGIASLATWDGDGNGVIDARDAVFSQLAVWQDSNGDGRVEQNEYHHLSDLGITSLNYNLGTYTKTDGSLHQMGTLSLQAQTVGNAYTAKTDGIQIDSSTGQAQLVVTQVHDLSSLQANEDGFATDENVPAVIQLRGNGSNVQGLLDNDHVSNAPNALLSVTGVGNAQDGTVSLDANSGTVTFTPNVGFYGTAGFDYTVDAGAYGQTTAHVVVNVTHVDQAPHITGEQNTQIPIYGYNVVTNAVDGTTTTTPIYQAGYGYGDANGGGGYAYRSAPVGYNTDVYSGAVSVTDVDDPISALTWSVVAPGHYGTASIDNSGHWAFSGAQAVGGSDAFMVQVKDPSGKSDTFTITVPLPAAPTGSPADGAGDNAPAPSDNAAAAAAASDAAAAAAASDAAAAAAASDAAAAAAASDAAAAAAASDAAAAAAASDAAAAAAASDAAAAAAASDAATAAAASDAAAAAAASDAAAAASDAGTADGAAAGDGGGDGGGPVILDLNGTGFHFKSVNDSNVFLQNASDGLRHRTAWFGGGNGVLAFDKYGDGVVHDSSQIAFKDYLSTAQTDLQGLAAFDSNHDGVITKNDALWNKLGVWVDANQDGISEAGEYKTLDALGITSISLTSNKQFSVNQGVTVYGETTFTRADGTTGQAADAVLPTSSDVLVTNADGSTRVTQVARATPANPMIVGDGNNLVLGDKGDNVISAGNGNNVISTGAGNDLIQAGNGNNTIMSGDGKDLIVVGSGNNTIMLGAGPKTVIAGKGNNLVTGGAGNNIIMAGSGNNTLYAGSGNSVVYAGNGDNSMVGGVGRNELIAGNGNNLFTDGGGRADMHAGTGSNTFVVTNTLDTITVAAAQGTPQGTNTVKTKVDWTLGANQKILWGTGSAALTLTGNDQGDQIIGNGAADTLIGGAGNDTLADSGGAATLIGGQGDDTYIVSNAATVVIEQANGGNDTVKTSVSYTLPQNVETLMGTGNAALTLTGGSQDGVTLVANNANDTLVAGSGIATLVGGTGNDTFVLNNTADVVQAQSAGNTNTILSSVSYTASANVQNLTGTGTADITLSGNGLANVITANAGNDTIVAGSGNVTLITGSGTDTLIGGAGSDTYQLNNNADNVFLGSGLSQVAGGNVNVTLTGNAGGSSTITLADGNSQIDLSANNNGNSITLGNGNSQIQVGHGSNNVSVGNGTNSLTTGSGVNALHVGTGNNTIVNQGGTDSLYFAPGVTADSLSFGSSGSDLLITEAASNGSVRVVDGYTNPGAAIAQYIAGDGNDTVYLDGGSYNFVAGNGTDSIFGGDGTETLSLGDGNDLVQLGSGNNSVTLGNGNSTVTVGDGANQIITGSGINTIHLGMGANTVTNHGGTDSVYLSPLVSLPVITYAVSGQDIVLDEGVAGASVRVVGGNAVGSGITQFAFGDGNYQVDFGSANGAFAAGNGGNIIMGANGSDRVTLGSGYNYIYLGDGNDTVSTADNAFGGNVIQLGNGDDRVSVGDGNNYVALGNGVDTLWAGDGANVISVGDGADTISLGNGNNSVNLGQGNDSVTAGNGNNGIYGGSANGNDTLHLGSGNNTVSLGNGNHNVTIADDAGAYEGVYLGSGNDTITLGQGNDTVSAGDGNDTVTGGNGNNNVYLGSGEDRVTLGSGSNVVMAGNGNNAVTIADAIGSTEGVYLGSGNNTVALGDGNDLVTAGNGDDTVIGGNGNDSVYLGSGQDSVTLGDGNNYIVTADIAGGVDTLKLGNGNNQIYTGQGNDQITAGNGNNQIIGGQGSNVVSLGSGENYVSLVNGDNTVKGGDGANTVYLGTGNNSVTLGNGNNNVNVGDGSNTVVLGDGNNLVTLGAGNDQVTLGNGVDTINTVGGFDAITLGSGQYHLQNYGAQDSVSLSTAASNQLWFQQQGADLVISVMGSNEVLTVDNWLGGCEIASLSTSDGYSITNTGISQLVQAMAAFAPPGQGQTSYTVAEQAALAPLLGASWH